MPDDDGPGLAHQVANLRKHKSYRWALDNYHSTITSLIRESDCRSILEIGGGRSPSFAQPEIEALSAAYTVNDISARELSLAPDWVNKARFDIQTDNPADLGSHPGAYDLVFSNMVLEHVASFDRAYKNVFRLLSDGGLGVALHPVLYSVPFAVNRLLPDTVSRKLLRVIDSSRVDTGIPKFPAYYDGCLVSSRIPDRLKAFGFRGAWQIPFYGHNYYAGIPVVRDIHSIFSRAIMENDISLFATYSYTIVQK